MGDKTKIAWSDATWNTITGCTPVSAACQNCYARPMHERLQSRGVEKYQNDFSEVTCHDDEKLLTQPRRWKKPRDIFLNSMGDTFHPAVPTEFIVKMYRAMIAAPQHRFHVLTKRAQRMYEAVTRMYDMGILTPENSGHIWHGVTVEDYQSVAYRIYPHLYNTPSCIKFISCEPLLDDWIFRARMNGQLRTFDGIDWIIIGGESGPNARPMELGWVRNLISVGRKDGCKIFVKQLGSVWAKENGSKTYKGEDMSEWPEDLRVQEVL